MKQVVAHFRDGRIEKGLTNDFLPTKDRFHLTPAGSAPGTAPVEILIATVKAVFFVRDLEGSPEHKKSNEFEGPVAGRKVRVVFTDGEIMTGTTNGYDRSRPGFFLFPADVASNNERCFVVTRAAKEVTFL